MDLNDKVVLVTGASEGIGAATARLLRTRGAKLALAARSEEKLAGLAQPADLIIPGDLLDPDHRRHVVEETLARFGRIDVLINNAGIGMYIPSWRAPIDEVRRMFELNFFAALELVQLVVPDMRKRRSGCVVNISSIGGQLSLPWFTLYSSTKFALLGFSDGLRMELKPDGIHVIAVCPGYVKTGFQGNVIGGRPPDRLQRSKKFAITAEQCAEAIVKGIERDARTVSAPKIGRALVFLSQVFPSITDRILLKTYNQVRED